MASKSQTYFNNISPTKKNTISIVVNACKQKGITSIIVQAALCSIVSKESDFVPKGEASYATTSASRIRSIFGGALKSYTDAQIDQMKLDEKKFFSVIYGDRFGNGKEATRDGWLFRGRGFNQLTFRGNYKSIGKSIGEDLENKPELIEKLDIAAKALVQYYVSAFGSMKSSLLSEYGIEKKSDSVQTMNGIKDIAAAVRLFYQATAGAGKREGGLPIALYYDKGLSKQGDGDLFFPNDNLGGYTKARNRAPLFYKLISGGDLPTEPVVPVEPAPVVEPTNTETPQVVGVVDSESSGRDSDTNNTPIDVVIPGLTNIFPPTIKVEPIKFDVKNESAKYKREMAANVGWKPFIWYNGYQISDKDVSYFALYNDGLLPAVTIIFSDTFNLMKDKAFPLDDTKIKVFISSRTTNIRHILLEFKVKNFSINGDIYTIIGILNVNGLHVTNYKAYSKKTSYFAIQDICKETGIGFNSNIDDSGDKMTWINPGLKVHDFLGDILDSAYISDEGFSYGYIDFYYNFNYVDIEKELSRDNSDDKGVDTSGLSSNITGDDSRVTTLTLTNDKGARESDKYISEYKILNNSTSVSLSKGYLNISKFYDATKKEFLIFDVDSITSEGDKTIIMKGSPQDEQFYKENYTTTYVGKTDSDNSHSNYNYSHVHNSQNIEDLQKIGLKIKLQNPNYNLYRFQKIQILLTNQSATPGNDIKNDRISGSWFIIDIRLVLNEGKMFQEISLIKRELEVSSDELKSEGELSNNTSGGSNGSSSGSSTGNNPVENTTNPTDLTGTDVAGVTPYTAPSTTPVTQSTATSNDALITKHKLDLIPGSYVTNGGDKIQVCQINGSAVNIVMADHYLSMLDEASKQGIKFSITSAFRSPYDSINTKSANGVQVNASSQQYLYDGYKAGKPGFNLAAKPGSSNHGNGISLDLSTGTRGKDKGNKKGLKEDVYKWLINNSWKYGFVRGVATEEWHFDYLPNVSPNGPYAKHQGDTNRFYGDLGLDNIKIAKS